MGERRSQDRRLPRARASRPRGRNASGWGSSRPYNNRMRTTIQQLAAAGRVGAATMIGQEAQVPDTAKLERMAARFAPTDIGADVSKLPPADRRVLAKLIEASK